MHPQPFGQVIAWQHFTRRIAVFGIEVLNFWIAELPSPGLPLRLAGEQYRLLILKFLDDPRLIEPHAAYVPVTTIEQHGGHRLAGAGQPSGPIDDLAFDRLQRVGLQIRNARDAGQIQHVARHIEQHILGGLEFQPFQQRCSGRANSVQKLHRCLQRRNLVSLSDVDDVLVHHDSGVKGLGHIIPAGMSAIAAGW